MTPTATTTTTGNSYVVPGTLCIVNRFTNCRPIPSCWRSVYAVGDDDRPRRIQHQVLGTDPMLVVAVEPYGSAYVLRDGEVWETMIWYLKVIG